MCHQRLVVFARIHTVNLVVRVCQAVSVSVSSSERVCQAVRERECVCQALSVCVCQAVRERESVCQAVRECVSSSECVYVCVDACMYVFLLGASDKRTSAYQWKILRSIIYFLVKNPI